MEQKRNISFDEDVVGAVQCMRRGGVVLYPTDTIWGIGCDARCDDAVRRIYAIKRRVESKAMISLVGSEKMLVECVGACNASRAMSLMAENAGRPLTVVYPHVEGVAPSLLASDGSAALRFTSATYSMALCRELGAPVVSTSANISGESAPATFSDISEVIIRDCDYVAYSERNNPTPHSPSMIVKLEPDGTITVIRK